MSMHGTGHMHILRTFHGHGHGQLVLSTEHPQYQLVASFLRPMPLCHNEVVGAVLLHVHVGSPIYFTSIQDPQLKILMFGKTEWACARDLWVKDWLLQVCQQFLGICVMSWP